VQVNLFQALEATLCAVGPDVFTVAPILAPGAEWDVTVVVRDDAFAEAGRDVVAGDPDVSSVAPSGRRFVVRYMDDVIAQLGEALETGTPAGMATDDLLAGAPPCIVDFCDPNAGKALHLGHLRNIAHGHATAAALEAAGASVTRWSQIADAGRNVGEAMAGWLLFGDGQTPATVGEKPDHYVGRLYARYVREMAPVVAVRQEDAAVAHDLVERDDLAQDLMGRWLRGDPEAIETWRMVRDWAVAGQDETLARLGIRFDHPIYDSERVPEIPRLVAEALAAGVVRRKDCGAVVYDTGEESYPELPLTRPDGFPTQNLRVVAIWLALMRERPGHRLIHFSGDEWRAHRTHVEQLVRALRPGAVPYPTDYLLHGMVVTDDGVMSSSKGEPFLIDALFDQLVEAPEVQAAAREQREGAKAEDLVAMALLGLCLDRQMGKRLTVSPGRLLDERANGGWRLARAWARACSEEADGAPDPAPRDPAYRYLVMQSQLHRGQLRAVVDKLDTYILVRYLAILAEWYLGTPPCPRVDRLMRQILASGLSALGLLRTTSMRQPIAT
jgi:arginyl-tRNA synthetase